MVNSFRCLYGSTLQWCTLVLVLLALTTGLEAQERRAKLRISNAGFTITALPLLAAKDWGLFTANGLDMGGYRGGYTGGLMQAVVAGILAGENASVL